MNANTRVYYQDVDMTKVLDAYARGFMPPDGAALLQWDANYDPAKGRVWFKLTVELPAPTEKNIITLAR